jgi:transcriptional regulator with XRE-family HTH domain
VIGRDLKRAREQVGLSQRAAAEATGGVLSPAGLSRIEAGARYPTLRTLEALSSALGIRVTVERGRARIEVTS